jgi:arylsulfatase A-like enzyme
MVVRLRLFVAGFFLLLLLSSSAGAAAQPRIILISIDTLRADHLSAYGYRKIRTPNIDAFAERGTLFTHADAQVPLTLPSHTSLFTSTYPFENRIEENAERVPPRAVTLASVLRSHGYKTAAFVSSVFLEKQMGLDPGFDVYDSPFDYKAWSPLSGSMFLGAQSHDPRAGRDRRLGALAVRAAAQWLNANRNQPVFLFLHLYDLHKPYALPPGFKPPAGVSGYDAQLAYVDQALGSFRRTLVETGLWDRSLVMLLSDHGESLGDPGEANHG